MLVINKVKSFYVFAASILGVLFGYLMHRFLLKAIIISLLQALYPLGTVIYLDQTPVAIKEALNNVTGFELNAVAVCSSEKKVLYIAPPKFSFSICSSKLLTMEFQIKGFSSDTFLAIKYTARGAIYYSLFFGLLFLLIVVITFFIINKVHYAKNTLNIAVELNRLSSQVAHDIRSPLSAMQVGIGALTEGNVDVAKSLLAGAASRIRGIADDLLLSGMEPSKANFEHFYASKEIEAIIQEKKLTYSEVNFSINEESDFIVFGERSYFQRAISNFINNSLEARNTDKKPEIKIDISKEAISISDNGRGMDQGLLEQLLSGEGKTTKTYGFGLGFSGSVKLLETIDIKVDVKSIPNHGTTVLLTKKYSPI